MSLELVKSRGAALAKLHAKALSTGDMDDVRAFAVSLLQFMSNKSAEPGESVVTFATANPDDLVKSVDSVIDLTPGPDRILMNLWSVTDDDVLVTRERVQSIPGLAYQDNMDFNNPLGIHLFAVRNRNGKIRRIWIALPGMFSETYNAISFSRAARSSSEDFADLLNHTFEYTSSGLYSSLNSYFTKFIEEQ